MKEVGVCQECGRKVYTNDLDLCKRCNQEVGVKYKKQAEPEEEMEEEPVSMDDLGIEETSEEGEDKKEEEKTEEKEESKEEKSEEAPAEEDKEEKKK